MMRKVFYIITIINILFQAVYMTIGKYTTSEMGILKYVNSGMLLLMKNLIY